MDVDSALEFLARTPFAKTISQGAMAFPMLECVHVVAIATVVGTIAIVDLRLLGYRSHRRGVRQLVRDLLPYTWAAFAIALLAGSLLFISNAPKYAHNTQFQLKMLLILAAAVNMAVFHLTVYRRIQEWDERSPAPVAARLAGATSLGLWLAVVFLGRWVGFTL
jgi:putative copper export protein